MSVEKAPEKVGMQMKSQVQTPHTHLSIRSSLTWDVGHNDFPFGGFAQVHLVADGATEAWNGAVLDMASVALRNRLSRPYTACAWGTGDSPLHWRAGATQPRGCWGLEDRMGVGVPPSLLPSNFLAGLGADHSPSCAKRRLAARRPEVAITTKLLSRPEPPVPLHRVQAI